MALFLFLNKCYNDTGKRQTAVGNKMKQTAVV